MATPEEIVEIKRFSIMVWTTEIIGCCAPTEEIKTELIILAASHGCGKNETKIITTD